MVRALCAAATIAFAVPACTTPPKQAEASDADKGADVGGQPHNAPPQPVIETPPKSCCNQCRLALTHIRVQSENVSCADLTDLDPPCLEYFRRRKTRASECN